MRLKTILGYSMGLFLASLGQLCNASTVTPRTGMVIPAYGDQNWDVQMRLDFNIADASMCVQSGTNVFGGLNTVTGTWIYGGGAGPTFQNANNNGTSQIFNNAQNGKSELDLVAADGIGINTTNMTNFDGTLDVGVAGGKLGGGTSPYGRFAVFGSSADATRAYSGFQATSPISQSTLWSLPKVDGTNGQALTTDGSAHLSFTTITGGGSFSGIQASGQSVITTTGTFIGGSGISLSQSGSSITVTATGGGGGGNGNVIASTQNNVGYYSLTATNTINGILAGTTNYGLLSGGSGAIPFWNQVILGTSTLQSGSTFYVSSGTVNRLNVGLTGFDSFSSLTLHNGGTVILNNPSDNANSQIYNNGTSGQQQMTLNAANGIAILNATTIQGASPILSTSTLQTGATIYVASETVNTSFAVKGSGANPGNVSLGEGSAANVTSVGVASDVFWADSGSHTISANFNASASTFSFISSSFTPVANQYLYWVSGGPNNWVVGSTAPAGGGGGGGGGTPGSPTNSVQYNNAGSFGGSSNFQFNGTSVTVVSSMVVTSNGSGVAAGALLNVFGTGLAAGTDVFAVGSSATSPLLEVQANNPVRMLESGASIGNLQIGGRSDGDNVGDAFSLYEIPNTSGGQGLKIYDSNKNFDFFTANAGQGGNSGTFNFIVGATSLFGVGGSTQVAISSQSVTISTVVAINSGTNGTYSLSIGTTSSSSGGKFAIDISTTGHLNTQAIAGSTVTSCGANASVTGSDIAGTITTGAASPTACTLTFAKPFTNTPVCLCGANGATACDPTTISNTSVTFTLGVTETTIKYICVGSD